MSKQAKEEVRAIRFLQRELVRLLCSRGSLTKIRSLQDALKRERAKLNVVEYQYQSRELADDIKHAINAVSIKSGVHDGKTALDSQQQAASDVSINRRRSS